MTDRDLIRELADALRCIAEHPVKYESIPGLERPTEFAVGSHYWHAIGDMRRAARIALTAARERLAREDAQPSIDSVIDAYTAETGGPEHFNAEVLQRFIDRYPQHAAGLRRYSVIQLTSRQATPEEIEREDQPAAVSATVKDSLTTAAQPAPEPAEPVAQSYCRIELVTAVQTLASHFENMLYAFGGDTEARRHAEGSIAHALKIAARWNWNGAPPRPAPVALLDAESVARWLADHDLIEESDRVRAIAAGGQHA